VVQQPIPNQYAAVVSGNSLGISQEALTRRVSESTVNRIAGIIAPYILLGNGIDQLFTKQFFADVARSNPSDVTDALMPAYNWAKDVRQGKYLDATQMEQLADAMPDLFGDRWVEIMKVSAQVAKMSAGAGLVEGATFTVDAETLGEFSLSIPVVAEHFSNTARSTTLPYIADSAQEMIQSLLAILRSEPFLRAVRFAPVNNTQAEIDAAMMTFLQQSLGTQVRDTFRLANAAENIVRLLAVCPDPVNPDFVDALKNQAIAYYLSYQSMTGAAGNAGATFQSQQPLEEKRRWSIRINLTISW